MGKLKILRDWVKSVVSNKLRRKWYVANIFVGLFPFLLRILVWVGCPKAELRLSEVTMDVITFALVINITNLNELMYGNDVKIKANRTLIVCSYSSIALFVAFLVMSFLDSAYPGLANWPLIFVGSCLVTVGDCYLTSRMIDKNGLYND